MDIGTTIQVKVKVDHSDRSAVIDFTGTSAQHRGNYNAPQAVTRAVVLYVFRTLVGQTDPAERGVSEAADDHRARGDAAEPGGPEQR